MIKFKIKHDYTQLITDITKIIHIAASELENKQIQERKKKLNEDISNTINQQYKDLGQALTNHIMDEHYKHYMKWGI